MADPAAKKNTTLRTLFLGAALGAGATLAAPVAVNEAITAYRDGEEVRAFRMTVQETYDARPNLAPRVVSTLGIVFDIENVPARGVTTADDIWRTMKVGCTYNVAAFGLRTRDLGVHPVLVSAQHFPTPQCPRID